MASGVTHYSVCLTKSRRVCYRTNAANESLAVVADMHHHTELSFVDEFQRVSPFHYAVLLWCMLQAGPPFLHYYCAVALHSWTVLSATLQTMSITVVNVQDNRAAFRTFIALF
jgi:hypothetical protein